MNGITVKLKLPNSNTVSNSHSNKKILKDILKDQIELNKDYINLFYGCWIKCVNPKTMEYISGGILVNIEDFKNTIILKPINSIENLEINIKKNILYVKRDTEQYKSMQNFIILKNEIIHERELLNLEKKNFKLESKNIRKKIQNEEEELFRQKYDFENLKFLFFKKITNREWNKT